MGECVRQGLDAETVEALGQNVDYNANALELKDKQCF